MATQTIENLSREAQQKQAIQKPDITQETWYQKLPENQRADVLKIRDQIAELEKRLDILNASKKYNGSGEKSLKAGIARLQRKADADTTGKTANPEREKGDEAKRTFGELNGYESRFEAASKEADGVTKLITALNSEIEKVKSSITSMEQQAQTTETQKPDISKMSNADILKLAPTERLPYITKYNNISSEVASGKNTKPIEFTFSSGGKLNRDLYMYTTAGQVLPNEVREVSSNGVSYLRQGLSGEFYNPDSQKRLVIGEGTPVMIEKTENVSKISEENSKRYSEFIEKNTEYGGENYKNIIETAIEKGIEPKMFILASTVRNETFNGNFIIPQAELERYARDFAVGFSRRYPTMNGDKYSLESAIEILYIVAPAGSNDILEKYGYERAKVESYKENHPSNIRYNINNPQSYVTSAPGEYDGTIESVDATIIGKMTYCSRTAKENLERLGVRNPPQGNAIDVERSSQPLGPVPPNGGEGSRIADIFLRTNTENGRKFGHRVAAYQQGEKWYVLDPYYNKIPGKQSPNDPVLMETYISHMESQGHKIQGAKYYS